MSVDRRVGMKRSTRRVLAAVSAAVLVSPCVRAFAGDESPEAAAASSSQIQQWSLEQLLNIDITTVSKSSEKEFEAPGVISVLTHDDIRRFGGTTLADLLIRIPGLVGSGVFMTDRSVISPRGDQLKPSSSNVLLLINGRPVREVLEGGIKSEMLESFPVDAIERIEVVKGPGSVLYGSQAVSAVINVITKTPTRTGLSVMGMGTSGGFNSSATATVKAGDLQVLATGAYHQKPEWQTEYKLGSNPLLPPMSQQITIPNKGPGAYLGANYKGFRLYGAYAGWDNSYFISDVNAIGGAKWNKRFATRAGAARSRRSGALDVDVTYSRSKFEVDASPLITRDSHETVAEWTNFIDLPRRSQLVFGGLYDKISGNEIFNGLGFPIVHLRCQPLERGRLRADRPARGRLLQDHRRLPGEQDPGPGRRLRPARGRHLHAARRPARQGALRRGLPRPQHQRAVAPAPAAPGQPEPRTPRRRRTSTSASATTPGAGRSRPATSATGRRDSSTRTACPTRRATTTGPRRASRVRGRGQALRHQAALPERVRPLPRHHQPDPERRAHADRAFSTKTGVSYQWNGRPHAQRVQRLPGRSRRRLVDAAPPTPRPSPTICSTCTAGSTWAASSR
jgi:hypothetical protein